MNIDKALGLFSSRPMKYFVGANLLMFVGFIISYDVYEMPNVIGYVTLGLAIMVSLLYYFNTGRNPDVLIKFAFAVWLSLIFIAHNINFLIAFDYQGQYFIESKRNFGPDIELWALRLNDNQNIMMRVGVSSGDGVNIDLQKGLFGVYFGAWSNEG